MQVHIILPAAGLGTRMAVPGVSAKQFLSLGGVPVLLRSVQAFAAVERVASITLAVRGSEQEQVIGLLQEHSLLDRTRIVTGGDHRQESVSNALRSLAAEPDDVVLVHDAVRPLIDAATIDRTIDAILKHGAAIVGLPAVDTIKRRVDGGGRTWLRREFQDYAARRPGACRVLPAWPCGQHLSRCHERTR